MVDYKLIAIIICVGFLIGLFILGVAYLLYRFVLKNLMLILFYNKKIKEVYAILDLNLTKEKKVEKYIKDKIIDADIISYAEKTYLNQKKKKEIKRLKELNKKPWRWFDSGRQDKQIQKVAGTGYKGFFGGRNKETIGNEQTTGNATNELPKTTTELPPLPERRESSRPTDSIIEGFGDIPPKRASEIRRAKKYFN